jgi:hypothetical protein
VLDSHLLSIIVGDGVRLCNYPFNYPDQCFHDPRRTPARNQCVIPLQYPVAVHIGNTRQGHHGQLMIDYVQRLKKSPDTLLRVSGTTNTMHSLCVLLTVPMSDNVRASECVHRSA